MEMNFNKSGQESNMDGYKDSYVTVVWVFAY